MLNECVRLGVVAALARSPIECVAVVHPLSASPDLYRRPGARAAPRTHTKSKKATSENQTPKANEQPFLRAMQLDAGAAALQSCTVRSGGIQPLASGGCGAGDG